MSEIPPPVLSSAKLLYFANVDEEVEFTDKINLYVGSVDGEFVKVARQPHILITQPYTCSDEFLLMFCNSSWESVGVIGFASIKEAKLKAEKGYIGISNNWRVSPYTEQEVLDYLRDEYDVDPSSEWWKDECSFCGNSDELETLIKGPKASICKNCILSFHEGLNEDI